MHDPKPDEIVEVKIEKIEGGQYFTKNSKGEDVAIENPSRLLAFLDYIIAFIGRFVLRYHLK